MGAGRGAEGGGGREAARQLSERVVVRGGRQEAAGMDGWDVGGGVDGRGLVARPWQGPDPVTGV